ncbi:kinase-like domain-containing protein [Gamsiella multidivaricata]|uniref:kinase-like domain-containing protein n=1 Tax=Gamsiella multidivaricata TaxID=101098 RepID=UPI002220D6BA|nr:kinase-like domain-containing protein [Gamsiella multidivaricata]KAI7817941.1 kinase-like domain-containing protein [Gamsiella multidivaricata]
MEGRELFKYSFKGITNQESNNPETVVEGDISTYTLGDEIGGGTYAKVYRAVERNSNAIYACKAIDRSREMNKQEKDSIPFEIELLRTQSHKHIVKFKDSCHWGSMTYIFTEYINGVTLHVYCQHQNNYLTETEARHIFRQTCEAINYLHARSIVHRDIKSENIMITREDDVVKLIDFGLARDSSSREVLNTHCGTRPYMAPEAALSDESNGYGKWVDIWALGVLLFRIKLRECRS